MRIIYNPSIPEPFVPIIAERIEFIEGFLPNWCQELTVYYSQDNPNGWTLSVECDYNYRFIQLNVYDIFFYDNDWKTTLLHEMFHMHFATYTEEVETVLGHFCTEGNTLNYLRNILSRKEESVVQDMAVLARKLTDALECDTIIE